jgi:hypothetical protein
MGGFDLENTRSTTDDDITLETVNGTEVLWYFQTIYAVNGQPTAMDTFTYITDDAGFTYGLNNTNNGTQVWRVHTAPSVMGPIIGGDNVFMSTVVSASGGNDDSAFSFNRFNGSQNWNKTVAGDSAMWVGLKLGQQLIFPLNPGEEGGRELNFSYFKNECCTHRPAIVSLDEFTGDMNWIFYPEPIIATFINLTLNIPNIYAYPNANQTTFAYGPGAGPSTWTQMSYSPLTDKIYVCAGQYGSPRADGTAPYADSCYALNTLGQLVGGPTSPRNIRGEPPDIGNFGLYWNAQLPTDMDIIDPMFCMQKGNGRPKPIVMAFDKDSYFYRFDGNTMALLSEFDVMANLNEIGAVNGTLCETCDGGFNQDPALADVVIPGLGKRTVAIGCMQSTFFCGISNITVSIPPAPCNTEALNAGQWSWVIMMHPDGNSILAKYGSFGSRFTGGIVVLNNEMVIVRDALKQEVLYLRIDDRSLSVVHRVNLTGWFPPDDDGASMAHADGITYVPTGGFGSGPSLKPGLLAIGLPPGFDAKKRSSSPYKMAYSVTPNRDQTKAAYEKEIMMKNSKLKAQGKRELKIGTNGRRK